MARCGSSLVSCGKSFFERLVRNTNKEDSTGSSTPSKYTRLSYATLKSHSLSSCIRVNLVCFYFVNHFKWGWGDFGMILVVNLGVILGVILR